MDGAGKAEVLILLSAFNGAPYIARQIESIRAQSFRAWRMLVRDDGSTDDTVDIVRRFCESDPRISLIEERGPNVGPWESFSRLLSRAHDDGAGYVILSDQDDVWVPDKIEQQLALLRSQPTDEPQPPLLVHSDLVLVNDKLEPIHQSFSEFQRASYDAADPLGTLLIHNAVVGCTIAMNRPLLELAVPVPKGVLHDWWLAVCAAAAGTIQRTSRSTVLYRQHSSNVVGVEHPHAFLRELARHPVGFSAKSFRAFNIGVEQARHLRDRLRSRDGINQQALRRVERYCDAFAGGGPLLGRLRALRSARPRPQRATSKLILRALSAVFPFASRAFLTAPSGHLNHDSGAVDSLGKKGLQNSIRGPE